MFGLPQIFLYLFIEHVIFFSVLLTKNSIYMITLPLKVGKDLIILHPRWVTTMPSKVRCFIVLNDGFSFINYFLGFYVNDMTCAIFFFFFFFAFKAVLTAYESSQARNRIGAIAASLQHSHSNTGWKPSLWPTPQLMAMQDPWPTEQGQGPNPHPHGH